MSTSTFFGLELSRRALATQQLALDITGHNIANANTQGYTRQVANMTPTSPYNIPALGHQLSLGTGVTLDYISRARDSFVDRQFRWETAKQEYWGARQVNVQKIEGMLNEPSENSFHSDLDKFWSSWSELANNPDSRGARAVVRERALALIDSFHNMSTQIQDLRNDLNASIDVKIKKINSMASQIADLNIAIKKAEVSGDSPNDLRDKRDMLVDQLSQIIPVRVNETKDPNFSDREVIIYKLSIGDDPNQLIVDDSVSNTFQESNGVLSLNKPDGTLLMDVKLPSKLGSLFSDLEMNGRILDDMGNPKPGYLDQLEGKFNDLAKGVALAVNSLHKEKVLADGTTISFFTNGSNIDPETGITAANISLNQDIQDRLDAIASGSDLNAIGDNSIALAISTLGSGWDELSAPVRQQLVDMDMANSFGDYYGGNIVATIGVDVQEANRMKAGQDVMVDHAYNLRDSMAGVSLDEEMTNLVKFQKSYAAAARMVTMMDDMLDTIVNRMGVTR